MALSKQIVFLATVAFMMHAGCSPNKNNSRNLPLKNYTEVDVRRILKDNPSQSLILQTFGPPLDQMDLPDGSVMATYFLPLENDKPLKSGARFSGFEVYYRNSIVKKWEPIQGEVIVHNTRNKKPPASADSNYFSIETQITFSVVVNHKLKQGLYIDTPDLPNLGYISSIPDLSVDQLTSFEETTISNVNETPPKISHKISIRLTRQGAAKMEEITSSHIGEYILISLGHTPLLAPRIIAPITSGEFEMVLPDNDQYHKLHQDLSSRTSYQTKKPN